jgi:hypothetical protein
VKAKRYWIFGLVVAAFTVAMHSTGKCTTTKGVTDNIIDTTNYNEVYDVGGKPVGTETLAGITNLCLLMDVEDVKRLNDKFDERQFYLDVQKKIRLQNIRTLLRDELVNNKTLAGITPILNITVKAKSISDQSCAYTVSVSLLQFVILNRDPNIACLATTWYIPELPGCALKQELVGVVEHLVKDGVQVFTLEHMKANLPALIESTWKERFSNLTTQERQQAIKELERMKEVLIVAAFHGFKERVNITTGEEKEEAEKALRWAQKQYEQWKISKQKLAEALIVKVAEVDAVAEAFENVEVEPSGRDGFLKQMQDLLKEMQDLDNYAKESIKSIRELEHYEGEFAEIQKTYQKLSDATEVAIDKLKKVALK